MFYSLPSGLSAEHLTHPYLSMQTFHWHLSSYPHSFISPARRMHKCRRLRLGYFQQHPHGIHLMVGRLDLRQLDQGYPQGPDVCFVIVRTVLRSFTHHHLWGHPKTKHEWDQNYHDTKSELNVSRLKDETVLQL